MPIRDEEGRVVQYVGRLVEGDGLRYKYARKHVQKYIFGWSESKLWNTLCLVENTFNSIWLRESLNCTTNFGSNLSPRQINMIKSSHAKSVVLLWDEGTGAACRKAVKALRKVGVPAAFVSMNGQPDDHPLSNLVSWADDAHELALRGGDPCLDKRGV